MIPKKRCAEQRLDCVFKFFLKHIVGSIVNIRERERGGGEHENLHFDDE